MTKAWRDVGSLYQIYPRSFRDLNGDGVGDLNGITLKMDYLSDLGVDAIWISPFFTSPMTDLGYDVADYQNVDPVFGGLDDFRMLLDEAHARDIKVMIDLVPCHTSDQHPWFVESRSGRDNPKRDWYVWRDGNDGHEPNNWVSLAGGKSWTFDADSGQYYLHSFLPTQPDLNWDNPEVRLAIKDVVRFWFDMGVDGIRVDAIWGISKDPELRDDTVNYDFHGDSNSYGAYIHDHCKHGPHFQEYLHELASVCDEYDDKQMVFEFYPDERLGDIWRQYHDVIHVHPKATAFFMEHRQNDWHGEHTGWNIMNYLEATGENTPFFCLGNHDQPRVTSRLGLPRSRALQFLNLLCPGVSVMYYGDEIGMEDVDLTQHDAQDGFHHSLQDDRNRARTPMQWNSSRYAGFANVLPWLPVHPNRKQVNVAKETKDPGSLLWLCRKLLELRHELPILRHGTMEKLDTGNGFVLGFRRQLDGQQLQIYINFADSAQTVWLPETGRVIIGTNPDIHVDGDVLQLPGYGGVLIDIK